MGTTTESVARPSAATVVRTFASRLRTWLSWLWHAKPLAARSAPADLTLAARIRKFLWLSSGLFSAASFAIPVIGLAAFGTADGIATSFLAAIVSACLFGLTSLLRFGPDVA